MKYFLKFLGGNEYVGLLIPIVESLCNIEETIVRNELITSMNHILNCINHYPLDTTGLLLSYHLPIVLCFILVCLK